MARVGNELVPVVAGDADGELVGVEIGMGDQRQDFAGAGIHGDDGAVAVAQQLLGFALQVEIDGELQVLSRSGVLRAQDAHLAAVAVHDYVARAVYAAQELVVGLLHAVLAHHVAGLIGGVARLIQVIFAHLAHVADQVRGESVSRIKPALLVDGLELGQLVAVRLDEGLLVRGNIFFDRDGLVAGRGAEVLQGGAELFQIQVQPQRDHGQIGIHILILFADQETGDRRVVIHQQAVIAVKKLAPRRHDGYFADAVLLRQVAIVGRAQHLEIPQAGHQRQHHHQDAVLHYRGFDAG